MIIGFKRETSPLSDYEQTALLPVMVKCLARRVGKDKAVTNDEMCRRMADRGYEISDARVRKVINHIRIHGLVNCLMATNSGYYVTEDPSEMRDYIASLKGREDAIRTVREAMERQLASMGSDDTTTCS